MITTITDNPFFNQHKLATKFRNTISGLVYCLARYTDTKLVGTLFLHCRNDDDVITETDDSDWELFEPVPENPQALLTRLLECMHDGDRSEILSALDDISNHIRQMHELPRVNKDVVTDTTIYIVPSNEQTINSNTTVQDRSTEEDTSQEEGISL